MDVLPIAIGAAGAGFAYFLYLVARKGRPAALAFIKAKWNASKAQIADLGADVDQAHVKIDAALAKLGVLEDAVTTVQADIARLNGLAAAAPAAPAAPSFTLAANAAGAAPVSGAA